MLDKHYIRATFTPHGHSEAHGMELDPKRAESVTIVEFSDDATVAVFIDEKGMLRRGHLGQFSECVFMTL